MRCLKAYASATARAVAHVTGLSKRVPPTRDGHSVALMQFSLAPRTRESWLMILLAAAVAVAMAAILAAFFWPITDLIAAHDIGRIAGPARAYHLQIARDAARGRLIQVGTGLFFAAALVFTAGSYRLSRRTFELSEQGHVTDRYTQAIRQLGSGQLNVRIGGIFALERIAHDSPRDHPTVMEVLAAFVREQSREVAPLSSDTNLDADQIKGARHQDVQAAITAIGRRDVTLDMLRINLANAELSDASLAGANLAGANLAGANLAGANLAGANLTDSDLRNADLSRADLSRVDFESANLGGANLTDALLPEANLSGVSGRMTNFSGARLEAALLKGASLVGANMTGADLTGVHAPSADFSRAKLGRANLTRADLTGVSLTDADLPDAELIDANLTGARLGWSLAYSERNYPGRVGMSTRLCPACAYRLGRPFAIDLYPIGFLRRKHRRASETHRD